MIALAFVAGFCLALLMAQGLFKGRESQLEAERDRALEAAWAAERRAGLAQKREYAALDEITEMRRQGYVSVPRDEVWEPYALTDQLEKDIEDERREKNIDQKSSPLLD